MKATTRFRLYEIKEKILKPFSEVRRVVSQFFETEYFYRWKKTSYPWYDDKGKLCPTTIRNVWYLNNTWDGCGPIFGLLDAKLFHVYVNYRKYTSLPDWYLKFDDIEKFGTKKDKKIISEKVADIQDDEPSDVILHSCDICKLSKKLKTKLHGRIVGLHKVYTLRKDILKLSDMDLDFTEPYSSRMDKARLLPTQTERLNVYYKIRKDFVNDRKRLAAKVMDELLDCSEWED